jgi:threonine/homoserine/homoserine lactone efflux protein
MPAWSTILLFVITSSVVVITPGPAVLYIIACSLAHGQRGGVISVMGTATGNLLHAGATTLGISALLVSSALAFRAVQYCGATLLIYHGLRTVGAALFLDEKRHLLGASGADQALSPAVASPCPRLFVRGLLINLLNPVTMLFFYGVLPQFVEPSSGPVASQMLFLGSLYAVLGFGHGSLYAFLAAPWSRWLQGHARCWRLLHGLLGSLYIGLGLCMACAGVDKV